MVLTYSFKSCKGLWTAKVLGSILLPAFEMSRVFFFLMFYFLVGRTFKIHSFSNFQIHNTVLLAILGLPRWLSDKESAFQCRRCKRHLIPGVGRSPEEEMTTCFSFLTWKIP